MDSDVERQMIKFAYGVGFADTDDSNSMRVITNEVSYSKKSNVLAADQLAQTASQTDEYKAGFNRCNSRSSFLAEKENSAAQSTDKIERKFNRFEKHNFHPN